LADEKQKLENEAKEKGKTWVPNLC
jgi:hypothetical protein